MLESLIFILFALPAVIAGVAILVSTNIVRMAFWLIAMLISVAGLYFLMGAYFLGVIQILVYVGGVAVVLVFGVMLTSRQLAPKLRPGPVETLWLVLVSGVLLLGLTVSVVHTGIQPQAAPVPNAPADIGHSLMGDFLGPFELASVLLLVALLGAAYLARPKVPVQVEQGTRVAARAGEARGRTQNVPGAPGTRGATV
jgi:NADH:ubiquinone oxidoreductase subunit 6 (subunit J)